MENYFLIDSIFLILTVFHVNDTEFSRYSYKPRFMTGISNTEACSTMRALGVLSSAFSLNANARQGACKRSRFKSIGVLPENQRWLPKL